MGTKHPKTEEIIPGTKEIIEGFFDALASKAGVPYAANEGRLPFMGKDLAWEIGGNTDFPNTSKLLLANEEVASGLALEMKALLEGKEAGWVPFEYPNQGRVYFWLHLSEVYPELGLLTIALLVSDSKEVRPSRGTGDTVVMCRMHKVD